MPLYSIDEKPKIKDSGRLTLAEGIVRISDSPVVAGKYYNIPSEYGYILVEPDSPNLLSQYDLKELGFTIIKDNSEKFDHLDGETPPTGLVRDILVYLQQRASSSHSLSHAQEAYNYQRLISIIDSGMKYSSEEFRRAIHNVLYSKDLYKIIAQHPSEWFFKSNELMWLEFLTKLLPDAPHCKTLDEDVIDKLSWMQEVTVDNYKAKDSKDSKDKKNEEYDKVTLGPLLWHMHPVMFLDLFKKKAIITGKPINREFVDFVFKEAKMNEINSQIPAAITTAQAILETGYGKHVPIDIHTHKYSNNLFGIKAHGYPDFVECYTKEVINGKTITILDKFRVYPSYEENISGRALFFVKNPRYHFLFKTKDPITWAEGLQESGYATDPDYAKKLIFIMKKERLL